jgi:N-acetylmuramoyl-L-alanine amidase
MKCILVVGHKKSSQGACNKKHGICEYDFNEQLACDVYDKLKDKGSKINVRIIKRKRYKDLPDDINKVGGNFFISLHCNAFNGEWNGTETLYYYKSKNSRKIAEIVQGELLAAFGFKNRGVLPRATEDRGGTLLRYTNMPGVIAEPFFIDNNDAYETVMKDYDKIVKAYVDSIETITKNMFT